MSHEKEPMLPISTHAAPSAETTGGPLFSLSCFGFGLLPLIVVFCMFTGRLGTVIVGITALAYLVIVLIIYTCARTSFQIWALQRPNNLISRLFVCPIEIFQSMGIGGNRNPRPQWDDLRRKWGSNFCASGEVWLGSFASVEKALTEPQARTTYLGEHRLVAKNLPDVGGRCVFLLALSDEGAGGTGHHEAFRKCMLDYVFSSDVAVRRQDATSERLFEQLVQDYFSMPHGQGGAFFVDAKAGLTQFYLKYLHYVLFGIDPFDEANMKILAIMNPISGVSSIARYIEPFGYLFGWDTSLETVGSLYEKSAAFESFKERVPMHHMMTKRELARLMVSIMRIAALQGAPLHAATILGGEGLPPYADTRTGDLDVTQIWDGLNLDDTDELHRYIWECTRLASPVTVSHRVATESFSCDIAGKTYTFPKGTKIAIPVCMANVDKDVWGTNAYEFDMNRSGLIENHCGFNSVGGRHAGRECPAKELVMWTATEMLRRIGRKRRAELSASA